MASQRGNRVTLALLIFSILAGLAWTIGPYVFSDRDIGTAIDSTVVRKRAEVACARMVQRIEAGRSVDRSARAMVRQIRALGTDVLEKDKPTLQWLDDWDDLLDAHASGKPIPEMGDGVRITRRMDDLVKDIDHCAVPDALQPRNFGKS
jgi:hypothetical protein